MRSSFGPKGGRMLSTLQRVGASRDPISHSSTSSSSSSSSASYRPLSLSSSPWPLVLSAATNTATDDFDWVSVNDSAYNSDDDNNDNGGSVFGSVPSMDEVLNAVSALQLVIDPTHYSKLIEDNHAYNLESTEAHESTSPTRMASRVSSFGSESDWIEPSMYLCYPMMLERHGSIKVYDALHLLQTEPSIKRMVLSLSSDKAVWDAVLNNEMVRELRDSLSEVHSNVPDDLNDNDGMPETVTNIFTWVYENTKVKLIEMIERITELVNELFQSTDDETITEGSTTGRTEEMLQISVMLSIIVLIIVVVDRANWA